MPSDESALRAHRILALEFFLLRRRHEASDETVYAHKHTRRDILPTLTTAHFETYTRLYTPACLSDDDANIPYAI